MADNIDNEEFNPIPIILGVVVIGFALYFLMKPKKRIIPIPAIIMPQQDPCKDIPDWACGTVSILNPLAKASVDIYRTQTAAEIQKAQLKARY